MAVGMGEVAMPDAFVTALAVELPANVALAPDAGAVNVTVTPDSGFEAASSTLACNAALNCVPAVVLCGVPLETTTEAGAGVFERANWAGVRPPTEAVTL